MRPPWCPLHKPSLTTPFLLLLLLFMGEGAGAEGWEDPGLLVTVRGGQLRGIRLMAPGGPVSAFLGIPFAEPPVGPRRFLPPEPKRPWSGVLDATAFQSVCYQYVDTLYPGFEGSEMWNPNRELSEDCLYLNVWTPYPRPASPAPVLVWIYGGGFYSGASSLDVYDGRFLAQAEGTVLVSMNYRVGAFGFLALPGSREAPGNVGLLDQRLALQWVQENVAAFGGDPMSVTLFGESAGGASVGMHLLSPPSRGLFHRAVLQSGAPNGPWATVGVGEARRRATMLARFVGCAPGGAAGNDTELVACLRTRPAQDLVDHEWHVLPQESVFRFSFVPVVDGDFLSDTPEALMDAGDFHGLQVLVGVVKDEGSYFLVYGAPGFSKDNESLISRAQFLAGVRVGVPQASDLAAEAVVLHYTDWLHPEDPELLRDAMSDVVGDHNVVCPVAQLAGRLAAQGAQVYAYIFEHRASTLPWPLWMGVPHGYEIEFVFGLPLEPSLNYTVEEKTFAQRLMRYWANFARKGDPNNPPDPKVPQWPQYTAEAQQYVSLNLRPLEVRQGLRTQACAFWNRFLPKLLSATDTLDEAERQWKAEFHRWSSYMVHWKNQFDHYSKQDRCSDLGAQHAGSLLPRPEAGSRLRSGPPAPVPCGSPAGRRRPAARSLLPAARCPEPAARCPEPAARCPEPGGRVPALAAQPSPKLVQDSAPEFLEFAPRCREEVSALPLLPATLEPLRDVHLGLAPPRRGPARLALVSGHYLYYHYGCDGVDDRGWGCGYRTLQTLCSWPEGRSADVPGLAAVQGALEDMGDKPPGFRGSRSWIGCVEACLCLDHFRGPQGRLCHVPRGTGLQGQLESLYSHFAGGGGPVMVGGDADAQSKALLGVCLGPGTEAYVLVLDPHCWGAPKKPTEIQAAGWVGWREASTAFDCNSFYNLCLTSRNPREQQHTQD